MVKVNKLGILLKKTPHLFECDGVLNPAVIKSGNDIHVFYRAVTKGNYSTLGYCKLSSPMEVAKRNVTPIIFPEFEYEFHGIEDPRIVKIEDTYYITYTAFDGINALGAMATSKDLVNWKKEGIIVPEITYKNFEKFIELDGNLKEEYEKYNGAQETGVKQGHKVFLWDKNLVLFPRKIDNKFCFLHRIRPNIQILVAIESFDDLTSDFWEKYFLKFKEYIILKPKFFHEKSYVGAGCPPIETPEGWLVIYHGVRDSEKGFVYSACAALLDLNNPKKELSRLPYPLFFPEKDWELKGEVNNVCFPTGAVLENDTLYIYYGAADETIAVASVSLKELLAELKLFIN
jgi:predicted GH43/DUF377 family glycosyl hydrolase